MPIVVRGAARWWVVVPAVAALTVGLLGIGVRSTFGGDAAVDEPQYLLTALSLWEDRNLDISDELAAERWRDFHTAELPVQTRPLAGGRQVSPHDPLLPALLAAPMGLFGWVGAKVAIALTAAACAGLLSWVAVRRFGIPPWAAGAGAAVAFASPPLGVYAQQVYPEMPAALLTLAAVAALSVRDLTARHLAVAGAACVALPWLGTKYAPVALVLALGGTVMARRRVTSRIAVGALAGLAMSVVAWLAGHQWLYGGWTPYATGDHFQATGELAVMGVDPDYLGRSLRLVALLVDDRYGLVPWQPAYAALAAAVALVAWRWRRDQRLPWLLLGPLAAGWAVAVWAALTMHGFWSPGRQVVVVLPLAVLVILLAAHQVTLEGAGRPGARAPWLVLGALGSGGLLTMGTLLLAGRQRRLTWVSGFDEVPSPVYQAIRWLTPDYRGEQFLAGHVVWAVLLVGSAALAVRASRVSRVSRVSGVGRRNTVRDRGPEPAGRFWPGDATLDADPGDGPSGQTCSSTTAPLTPVRSVAAPSGKETRV